MNKRLFNPTEHGAIDGTELFIMRKGNKEFLVSLSQMGGFSGSGGGTPLLGVLGSQIADYISNSGRSSTDADPLLAFAQTLDDAGISDDLLAIYLLNGQSEAKNKLNLLDPEDLDSAFRLLFSDAVHGSLGVSLNAGGYADTLIYPQLMGAWPDIFMGTYTQDLLVNKSVLTANAVNTYFYPFESGSNKAYSQIGCSVASGAVVTGGNKVGMLVAQRKTDLLQTYFQGVKVAEEAAGNTIDPNNTIKLSNGAGSLTAQSIVIIGNALTDSKHLTLSDAVQTLMTAFSINSYENFN